MSICLKNAHPNWLCKGGSNAKSTFTRLRRFATLHLYEKENFAGIVSVAAVGRVCHSAYQSDAPAAGPNASNLYPVEVSFDTRQQTVRWNSIQPKIVVGSELYEMRPTPLMTNRWEGLIPVPPGTSLIHYRYKLDFQYNRMGKPGADTALSQEYSLRVLDQ